MTALEALRKEPAGWLTARTVTGSRSTALLISMASLVLYLLTIPGNESESDDGFEFAYSVRAFSDPGVALFRRYHLLYLAAYRGVYRLTQAFHAGIDAHTLMVVVSAVCASAALAIFYLVLRERLGVPATVALAGTVLLGLSYGYWRYAVDPKTYAVANLLCLALLYLTLGSGSGPRYSLALVLLAVAALCADTQSAGLACVVVPILLIAGRRWLTLVVYGVTSTILLLAAYVLAAAANTEDPGTFLFAHSDIHAAVSITTPLRAALGFAQEVVAIPFVFGLPGVSQQLSRLVPTLDLDYQVYTAMVNGRLPTILGSISALVLLVLTLAVVWVFVRRGYAKRPTLENGFALIWLVAYLPPVVLSNPAGKELWVMALVPFWLWVTQNVVRPMFLSDARRLVLAFMLVLGLHNYWAGMGMMRNPDGSLYRAQSTWLLANAGPGDLVLTYDKDKFSTYLRYHTSARVIDVFDEHPADLSALDASVERPTGSVYVMESVLEPSGPGLFVLAR